MFLLFLAGSARFDAPADVDSQWRLLVAAGLASGALAPLSLTLNSRICGFIAIFGSHLVCTLVLAKLGLGNRLSKLGNLSWTRVKDADKVVDNVGTGWRSLLCCGVLASLLQFASLVSLRMLGLFDDDGFGQRIQAFATGGVFFGHISYFAMLMLLSSTLVMKSTYESQGENRFNRIYLNLNGVMVISLSVALFLGKVFQISALNSTANVMFVLWLMIKELELAGERTGVKLLALYVLYQFLDQEAAVNMFDPSGLYA